MWSIVPGCGPAKIGARAGVNIPLQAAEHYYLITEQIEGISNTWPVIEDPTSFGYYREEAGGLMIGLFEPEAAPWKVEGVPEDFAFGEIPPDWDRMGPYVERAMERVPISKETGVRKLFCGPESFTPDLQPIVGEAPELKNYFVAAGLNSVGILTGGGLGRVLAHWIINGVPDVDVTGLNIDQMRSYQADPEYLRARTAESLGMVYRTTSRTAHHRRHAAPSCRPFTIASRRLLQRGERLGRCRLVCARRRGAGRRAALLGPGELVPLLARRARSGLQRRGADGTCRLWPSSSSRDPTPEPCSSPSPLIGSTVSPGASPTPHGSIREAPLRPT